MGSLKPGATYIYERTGNEVYAREFGADPADRTLVGYGYDPITGHRIDYDSRISDGRSLHDHIMEDKLWGEIRRKAKTNATLNDILNQAIMVYNLIKDEKRN
jgi:hypothetical protein